MGWSDKLRSLFGGAAKPPAKKRPADKTYSPPGNRAALLKEAMAIYGRERANARGVLEQALKDQLKKPPRPSDMEGMTRLLSLRKALLSMNGAMSSDLKRFLVQAGIRELMDETPKDGKPPPRRVIKR